MLAELRQLVETNVADEPLRRLVLGLLDRHAEALKALPATQNKFHPFAGGLLEHTLSVTKNCLWLVEKYAAHYTELKPPLNKDLVAAAAALHDLGRVLEFADPLGRQPTIPGRLVGHLMLGRDLVRDAAREQGDVNPELVQLLEHLVVTHLTLPEWGSPRLPLIPEVLILHHADDLDAKLEMYARCLSRDTAPGPFTDRDPVLNRQLLKGRTVLTSPPVRPDRTQSVQTCVPTQSVGTRVWEGIATAGGRRAGSAAQWAPAPAAGRGD